VGEIARLFEARLEFAAAQGKPGHVIRCRFPDPGPIPGAA
jgi:hypothetical protein